MHTFIIIIEPSKKLKKRHAYILEGQGDVWRVHEAGVKNAVGLFGKTFLEQFQKL